MPIMTCTLIALMVFAAAIQKDNQVRLVVIIAAIAHLASYLIQGTGLGTPVAIWAGIDLSMLTLLWLTARGSQANKPMLMAGFCYFGMLSLHILFVQAVFVGPRFYILALNALTLSIALIFTGWRIMELWRDGDMDRFLGRSRLFRRISNNDGLD